METDAPASGDRSAAGGAPSRDAALDGLRTVAVLLMIASHTTRLIAWGVRRDWSRFSLLIEPLTASLFLFLVGTSLVYSRRAFSAQGWTDGSRTRWISRQSLRALALWSLSCLFYVLEDGFHWPDAVLLSGILATIAYAILWGMLWVGTSRPVLYLAAVAALMAAVFIALDIRGRQVFMVNAGNSPLLPLVLFTCLGALAALALDSRKPWVRPAWLAAAALAMGLLLFIFSFQDIFSRPLGRSESTRVIVSGPPEARLERTIPYYNLRPVLVTAVLALIVLLYSALAAVRPLLDKAAGPLLALGRRSLDVYILHLSLLAILVLRGGKRPLTETWQGDAAVLSVILICWLWAAGRDALTARKLRRAGGGKNQVAGALRRN